VYYEKKYDSDKKRKRSIKEIITGTPSKKHQNEEEEGGDGSSSSSINLRESYKKIQSEKKLKEYEKENMKRSKEEESKRSLHERFVKWRERKQKLEEKTSNPYLSLYNYCIVPHKQLYDYFLGLFFWLID